MSTLTERIDNLLQSIYERTSDSKLEKNCDEIIAQKKLQPLEAERYYIFRELNVGAAGVGGICQLMFEKLSSPSENPYNKRKGSKYLNQKGPDSSKIGMD